MKTGRAEPALLGLDWVDSKKGWAYCQLGANSARILGLGCLPVEQVATSPLVLGADRIVVDASASVTFGLITSSTLSRWL